MTKFFIKKTLFGFIALLLSMVNILMCMPATAQQTQLRVFVGPNNRPDLQAKLFEQYEKVNTHIKIQIETGGITSEMQHQYLSTLLENKDYSIDLFLVDVVNVAQYAKQQWVEPLDKYIGSPESLDDDYIESYKNISVVDGRVVALPRQADALFVYYRKDLLKKYQLTEPKTWNELIDTAKYILSKENNPKLQGLSFQGAPTEGAVCTFLLPYWGQLRDVTQIDGKLFLDRDAAIFGLKTWIDIIDSGVANKNMFEVSTPRLVSDFQSGNTVFAINWGFAYDVFKNRASSKVKDAVGVMALPTMPSAESITCMGGWQWVMNAYSHKKDAAGDLLKYLSSKDVSEYLAAEGSVLPVYKSVYFDQDVNYAVPWLKTALPIVLAAKSRPTVENYERLSEVIRENTSAALAKKKTPEQAVDDIIDVMKKLH